MSYVHANATYSGSSLPDPLLQSSSTRIARDALQPRTSKYAGLAIVALFHAALIYGLINQLSLGVKVNAPPPIQARIIEEVKPHVDVPPPAPIFQPPPPPYVPLPEIVVAQATQTTNAIQAVTAAKPIKPVEAAPPPAVAQVEPELDTQNSSDPVYPAISRRLQEQGLVALLVLVGPDGRVQDVKVERSSGFPRLDEAAVEGAKNGCRFHAGTVDGKPAAMWYRYQYQFSLS